MADSAVVVADKLVEVFENGYVSATHDIPDAGATISRATLHGGLQALLRPIDSDRDVVIVGANGTGKVRRHLSLRAATHVNRVYP